MFFSYCVSGTNLTAFPSLSVLQHPMERSALHAASCLLCSCLAAKTQKCSFSVTVVKGMGLSTLKAGCICSAWEGPMQPRVILIYRLKLICVIDQWESQTALLHDTLMLKNKNSDVKVFWKLDSFVSYPLYLQFQSHLGRSFAQTRKLSLTKGS